MKIVSIVENVSVNPNIVTEDGGISADDGENEFYVIIKKFIRTEDQHTKELYIS